MTVRRPALATGAEGIDVRTVRHPLPPTEALSAYPRLAARFGADQAYVLELAAEQVQLVGFGVLLTVSVTCGVLRIDGAGELRDAVLRAVGPLVTEADGELRLPDSRALWPVLRAVQATFRAEGSGTRFGFGFLSYFGYDTNRYIEELPYLIEQRPDLPDVHLVLHRGCLMTDLAAGESELLLHESPAWPAMEPGPIITLLSGAGTPPASRPSVPPDALTTDDTTVEEFLAKVDTCLEHIAIGDIYQVQIGHELAIRSSADPFQVYLRVRERNPSPYMYLTALEGHTVIGASPELFVKVEDGQAVMRPIAGTVPRGADGDAAAERWLRNDPKELAEHTMLVDLCRNDLGRICLPGTLRVPGLFTVERYSHVLHLVSTVAARTAPGTDAFDVIAAVFPAGTMTGTPKIRAMEIIEKLEKSRRGLYAGAIGLIDVGGYVNLALCIRTLIHADGVYRTRASAGIVADSKPEREWNETLAKASAAYWAVTGEELL